MNKGNFFFFSVLVFLLTISLGTVYAEGNALRIREILYRCEQDTGVHVNVTSRDDYDRRSARKQAELMADMSVSTLRNLYKDNAYTQDMARVTATGDARVAEFERIINKALSGGYNGSRFFISSHLTGDALDISPSTPAVKLWLENNGISVRDETNDGINCWHLQLR